MAENNVLEIWGKIQLLFYSPQPDEALGLLMDLLCPAPLSSGYLDNPDYIQKVNAFNRARAACRQPAFLCVPEQEISEGFRVNGNTAQGAGLSGQDLTGVRLTMAILTATILKAVDLRRVDFTAVDMNRGLYDFPETPDILAYFDEQRAPGTSIGRALNNVNRTSQAKSGIVLPVW